MADDWWRKPFEANMKKLESLMKEDLNMYKIDQSRVQSLFTMLITYLFVLKKTGTIKNVNGNPETSNAGISSISNSNQLLSSLINTKADLPCVTPSKPVDFFTNTANQRRNNWYQLLSSSINTKADLPGVTPSKPVDSFINTANQLINSNQLMSSSINTNADLPGVTPSKPMDFSANTANQRLNSWYQLLSSSIYTNLTGVTPSKPVDSFINTANQLINSNQLMSSSINTNTDLTGVTPSKPVDSFINTANQPINSNQLMSSSINTKADLPGVTPSKLVDSFTNTANQPINSDLGISDSRNTCLDKLCGPDGELPQKLRTLPKKLIEQICNEIMDKDPNVRWDDIAGLHHAKKCVNEMVVWPLLRPDLFQGCRTPGRGLLLFGPPGTGKTMIGKAIAGEAKATFFYISASSLTSKWLGESEKLVRALFGVASCCQPAVIFVDEIDSLLSKRKSEGEHQAYRRLKTQILIEMEGCNSVNDRVLLIGATNRPQDLDEAARRRLTKRLYIPLPCADARAWIIENLLKKDNLFKLSTEDMEIISKLTEGYSGSDMKNLVTEASMGPLREALTQGIEITKLKKEDMRPVTLQDFKDSLQEIRPSVSLNELGSYEDWDNQFGSLSSSKTRVSSQQASGSCDEKDTNKPSSISSDSLNHHMKKRKTSSLGEYRTLSDAKTCNGLNNDVS